MWIELNTRVLNQGSKALTFLDFKLTNAMECMQFLRAPFFSHALLPFKISLKCLSVTFTFAIKGY
jgi:hypothetical protein